jgi:Tol biopolymer transport system component/serine/threonine protein kinase
MAEPTAAATERIAAAARIADGLPLRADEPGGSTGLRRLEALARAWRQLHDPPPAVAPCFEWGPLQVHERIGRGAFAEVFRARDPQLDRDVALKLRRPAAPDALDEQRFLAEGRRLARVRDPHVVAVHGAARHDGRVGLWTDLVEGRTLRERVQQEGPLATGDAAAIGIDLCSALAAVHAAGLVHGDVGPGNVMQDRDGRVLLMDFGAAHDAGHHPTAGTPLAVAPEVLRGEAPDQRADLYSLGALLYFLASGAYPVEGDDLPAITAAHRSGRRLALRTRRPGIDAAFAAVVERALAPQPRLRFDSAGAMQQALRATLQPRPARPQRAIALVIGGAVAIGLLALLAVLQPRAPQEPAPPAASIRGQAIVSNFPGHHDDPHLSPDGSGLAFVSDASGQPQVWLLRGDGEPRQLTFDAGGARSPVWTAREEIVHARPGAGLWAVPVAGGAARRIVAAGDHPSVSADGRRIVYEHDRVLWLVEDDGESTPQRIAAVPPRMYAAVAAEPALSPDGRHIAWFQQQDGPLGDLWTLDLDGGRPRQLTFDRTEAGAPAWSPAGGSLVFWSNRAGSRTLWRIDADGGSLQPLTTGAGEDRAPAIAPDGRSIVFANRRDRWRLVLLDPGTGARRVLLDRRLGIYLPDLAPDAERVAFSHHEGSSVHLFTVRLDGRGLRRLTDGEGQVNLHPRWLGDGRTLLHYAFPQPALRRLDLRTGSSTVIAPGWQWETHSAAQPDPDGHRVAYLARSPERETTMVLDTRDGSELALPPPHLHGIKWLPDGVALVGWTHDDGVVRCALRPPGCAPLAAGSEPVVRNDRIWFQRPGRDAAHRQLWTMALDGSDPRPLSEIGPLHFLGLTFDVTADGRIVYIEHEAGRSELWRLQLQPPLD